MLFIFTQTGTPEPDAACLYSPEACKLKAEINSFGDFSTIYNDTI